MDKKINKFLAKLKRKPQKYTTIDNEIKKMDRLRSIMKHIQKKEMSIAELQKITGMKRSTLNYYITLLEIDGYVSRERIEQERGRPTILKFNHKFWEKKIEENKKRDKENRELVFKNPKEIFKVLKYIKDNPKIDAVDLIYGKNRDILSEDNKKKSFIITILHMHGFVGRGYFITKEGNDLLRKLSKKQK